AQETSQLRAGWWLSLALIKPSVALPFLILPLVRRRWRCLAVVGLVHGGLTVALSCWLGRPPWPLLAQGLGGAGDVTHRGCHLALIPPPQALPLCCLLLLQAAARCWQSRAGAPRPLTELLCFVSLFWTYHGSYDFILLLPPLLAQVEAVRRDARPARRRLVLA